MILAFSKDQFIERIKKKSKIHTIRADKNERWESGRKIEFWRGNPRNIQKYPFQFGTGVCSGVELVSIFPKINRIINHTTGVITQGKESLNRFAVCDGFKNWQEMKGFFNKDFFGKIIYWDLQKCKFENNE